MLLNYYSHKIRLINDLQTSYGIVNEAVNGFTEISFNEITGYGEAVPMSRYGENIDNVLKYFQECIYSLGDNPWDIEKISESLNHLEIKSAAAKSAIIMSLYDLCGKLLNIPLYQLLGLGGMDTPYTSYTIGVDTPDSVIRKVLDAKEYPIIKLKIGTYNDIEAIKAIREVSNAEIRVDANGSWTPEQAIKIIESLTQYNIQFIEQPVAAGDLEGLRFVREHVELPIIADESCRSISDIPLLVGCVDGINIKLAKCGGIREALKMIYMAKSLGLKVMIGSFLESSLATTAAAHLTPLADYADLDPILFLKEDPCTGVCIKNGKIILPQSSGLGVIMNEFPNERRCTN